jgi:CubicO group peptidase (beta-lactamase class C family)
MHLLPMNAPGLTLGLANAGGPVRAAGFGFADLEAKTPLTAEHMFEIGSITKSFVALTLLQLRDEGKLDQRPWSESAKVRIFEPLWMRSSAAVITNETRARRAQSYVPFFDDLTFERQGRLTPAGNLVFDNAAGSVTSTPGDMALYAQMLLRKGKGPDKRIVSEESFGLFTHPYIAAKEFSPTASYGYGIGVDKLDGRTILRHTSGMASFMSALMACADRSGQSEERRRLCQYLCLAGWASGGGGG